MALARLSHPELPLNPAKFVITQDTDIGFLWGAFKASGNQHYLDKILDTLLQQSESTSTSLTKRIITTAIQTLNYHRSTDGTVNNHYLNRYANLSAHAQEQLDILFADHESDTNDDDDDIDCD